MSPSLLILLTALSFTLIACAFVLLRMIEQQDQRRTRVAAMQISAGLDGAVALQGDGELSLLGVVAKLGQFLARSGLLPASTIAELDVSLSAAGFRYGNALGLFIGAKLLLALLVPLVAYAVLQQVAVAPFMRIVLIGASFVLGLLAPDMIIRRLRRRHLNGVERGLPDALDMLVICTEAGLGLEAGLERVATEIAPAGPEVAYELQLTATELRITADRRVALTNMGTRTGLTVMQRLGGTLIQTLQYGTPLSQALRTLAAEMRYEAQIRFEARAARLPVLLTLPMVIFILPCIFIVVGGPAALTVARNIIHN
jgi:tight adherence protein C